MRQSNYKSSFSTKISTLRIFRCTHIVIQFHIHIILHCYIMQLNELDVKVSFYNRHLSKDIAVFNLYILNLQFASLFVTQEDAHKYID